MIITKKAKPINNNTMKVPNILQAGAITPSDPLVFGFWKVPTDICATVCYQVGSFGVSSVLGESSRLRFLVVFVDLEVAASRVVLLFSFFSIAWALISTVRPSRMGIDGSIVRVTMAMKHKLEKESPMRYRMAYVREKISLSPASSGIPITSQNMFPWLVSGHLTT